jgi:glycine cleavage system H protein
VIATPKLANDDPYEKGWLLDLAPEDWDGVKAGLLTGAAMASAYEAKMAADGFEGCA